MKNLERTDFDKLRQMIVDNILNQLRVEALYPHLYLVDLQKLIDKGLIICNYYFEQILGDDLDWENAWPIDKASFKLLTEEALEQSIRATFGSHYKPPYSKSLSFFRALNPTSRQSGIFYCSAIDPLSNGFEVDDHTLSGNIWPALQQRLSYHSGLLTTYNILVGEHYPIDVQPGDKLRHGKKGALDFLIFPLISRKLIADTYLSERRKNVALNAVAWMIAVPLEITRFSLAITLTLLLTPLVALVHLIKACLLINNECARSEYVPQPYKR